LLDRDLLKIRFNKACEILKPQHTVVCEDFKIEQKAVKVEFLELPMSEFSI